MSEFTLRPARLRDGKFVPDRSAESVEVDWAGLVEKFAPSRTQKGLLILRSIRPGVFVGLRQKGKKTWNFIFDSAGRSRSAGRVIKQDPTFEPSLVELAYVENVEWGMKLEELGTV